MEPKSNLGHSTSQTKQSPISSASCAPGSDVASSSLKKGAETDSDSPTQDAKFLIDVKKDVFMKLRFLKDVTKLDCNVLLQKMIETFIKHLQHECQKPKYEVHTKAIQTDDLPHHLQYHDYCDHANSGVEQNSESVDVLREAARELMDNADSCGRSISEPKPDTVGALPGQTAHNGQAEPYDADDSTEVSSQEVIYVYEDGQDVELDERQDGEDVGVNDENPQEFAVFRDIEHLEIAEEGTNGESVLYAIPTEGDSYTFYQAQTSGQGSDGEAVLTLGEVHEVGAETLYSKVGSSQYQCLVCQKVLTSKKHAVCHAKLHTGEHKVQCTSCPMTFPEATDLDTHKYIYHSTNRVFKCSACKECFEKKDALTDHHKNHPDHEAEEVTNYLCTYCSYSTRDPKEITEHEKSHVHFYQCKLCSFRSAKLSNVVFHSRTHKDTADYPDNEFHCLKCPKVFHSAEELNSHKVSEHAPLPHKCTQCPFVAKFPSTLKRHMTKHTNEQQFSVVHKVLQCTMCPFTADFPSQLNRHMACHVDSILGPNRHFKCSKCSFETPYKGRLLRHLMTHGEGLHVCLVCGERFRIAASLQNHQHRQHGIPRQPLPYSCPHCNFQTKYKQHWKSHIQNLHERHNPNKYRCKICGFVGKTRHHYTSHMNQHSAKRHEQKRVECEKCGYVAPNMRVLCGHMKAHSKKKNLWKTPQKKLVTESKPTGDGGEIETTGVTQQQEVYVSYPSLMIETPTGHINSACGEVVVIEPPTTAREGEGVDDGCQEEIMGLEPVEQQVVAVEAQGHVGTTHIAEEDVTLLLSVIDEINPL